MPALSKPTNGTNADYANRIGLLFDAFNNGNYNFPATQVPSADPNTLDDYEEGTWTPAISFATPGNLVVAYASRPADYTKNGQDVRAAHAITTSTFTHTTAAGSLFVSGLPFAPATITSAAWVGPLLYQGITKASYTTFCCKLNSGDASIYFGASGSGQANTALTPADTPTGGTINLFGQIHYRV